MTKKLKAVLFDLDGTLLDSIEGILQSFQFALAKHLPERKFERQFLINTIGVPLEQQMLGFAAGDQAVATAMVRRARISGRSP